MLESHREMFDQWGAAHVRALIQSGQMLPHLLSDALEWLGAHDRVERERISASQAEQNRTALIAKNAAVVAAIAATITIPLAIIGIILSYLAWRYPHK